MAAPNQLGRCTAQADPPRPFLGLAPMKPGLRWSSVPAAEVPLRFPGFASSGRRPFAPRLSAFPTQRKCGLGHLRIPG